MKRVGLIVGHVGKGTGAVYSIRDEWTISAAYVVSLYQKLVDDGMVSPTLIVINCEKHPWDLVFRVANLWQFELFKKFGSLDIKAEWCKREACNAVIEMHINSDMSHSAVGHEVWVHPKCTESLKLGAQINRQFGMHLPTKNRGLKTKKLRLLKNLLTHNIPGCIIEPAFIQESHVVQPNFSVMVTSALANGLYKHLGV
jgi:N-acetylmuramoyl-L-alanine amidase